VNYDHEAHEGHENGLRGFTGSRYMGASSRDFMRMLKGVKLRGDTGGTGYSYAIIREVWLAGIYRMDEMWA